MSAKTLRDEFAMATLPGLIIQDMELAKKGIINDAKELAKTAYEIADAMLEARHEGKYRV